MDSKDGGRLRLFTPGPVDLSGAASRALACEVIHHRSAAFEEMLAGLEANLKAVFVTANPVATLTASGTGAMEAAVVNLFAPGERVLVPVSGKFSARWAQICRAHGIDACRMELEPGEAPYAEDVVGRLKEDDKVVGLLLTHCETSTGSLTDAGAICPAVSELAREQGRRLVTCVDCVTSLCIDEFRMDEWHVDCAIGASQKGFLGPPGLAFVAVGPGAIDRVSEGGSARYYFDLRKYLGNPAVPPFTPAIPLVRAVKESLDRILGLGLAEIWRACRASAEAIRLVTEAAGFSALARHQAAGVVAFRVDGIDAEKLASALRDKHGMVIAQGQGSLRGKILRVSPIGKGPTAIRAFAGALASVLGDMGRSLRLDDIETELDRILEESAVWESLLS